MRKFSLSVLLGVFVMIVQSSFAYTHSGDESVNKTDYDIMKIRTENGSQNSAAYFNGKSGQAVIFVPGAVFNKESWFHLAERLQRLNIASLSLDGKTLYDILSSIRVIKEKGFKKITLVGGSMGGAAILQALDRKTDGCINKVIVLAPSGGKPITSKEIKKLFVVAKDDRLGIYTDVKDLYERSSDPKKIVEFEGSEHAQRLFKTSHKEELSKLIIDFITD
jgi:pimeloyl-ACP methyl ester carboxylesterase